MKKTLMITLIVSLFLGMAIGIAAQKSPSEIMVEKILADKAKAEEAAEENYHKAVDPIIKKYSAIRDKQIEQAQKQAKLRLDLAKKQAVARKDDLAVAVIDNALARLSNTTDLKNKLIDTVWQWDQDQYIIRFNNDMTVSHSGWDKVGVIVKWDVISTNKVSLLMIKGNNAGKKSILVFSDDFKSYTGTKFNGQKISINNRIK